MIYQQLIRDNLEMIKNTQFIKREYTFPLDLLSLKKIITFVGARRVGKSTIMKQILHTLVENNHITRDQIIWIDGNEIDGNIFDITKVLEDYYTLFPKATPFFIIDEVHEIPDRVRQVFLMYNKGFQIFISGSNAQLLSSELSTKLRGKAYEQRISGLSWKEYIRFVNFSFDHTTRSGAERDVHFETYCHFGSFPEVALSINPQIKIGLLKNYFEVLLYKDLIDRYNIDKEYVIKHLIKYLTSTITKEFSIKNFTNQLASIGIKISKPSIYNYLEYLQNIFFIDPIRQQYRQRGGIKWYINNTGYISLRDKASQGKKLENLIYMHLRTIYDHISFGKNKGGEIDFVIGEEGKTALQVCWDLTPENFAREIEPLLLFSGEQKTLIYYRKNKHLILPNDISFVSVFDVLNTSEIEGMGKMMV